MRGVGCGPAGGSAPAAPAAPAAAGSSLSAAQWRALSTPGGAERGAEARRSAPPRRPAPGTGSGWPAGLRVRPSGHFRRVLVFEAEVARRPRALGRGKAGLAADAAPGEPAEAREAPAAEPAWEHLDEPAHAPAPLEEPGEERAEPPEEPYSDTSGAPAVCAPRRGYSLAYTWARAAAAVYPTLAEPSATCPTTSRPVASPPLLSVRGTGR
jgi:hypothetical protein